MAKKRRFIPFSVLPMSWGLSGKSRDMAKAEYTLTGEDLDRELVDIKHDDEKTRSLKNLDIDIKYKKVKAYDAELRRAELVHGLDTVEFEVVKFELELEHKKITEMEAEKGIATARGEPWVGTIGSEYDSEMGKDGLSFELDWNDAFVEMLRDKGGYDGIKDEHIIEQWFDEVARSELASIIEEDAEADDASNPLGRSSTKSETINDGKTEKKKYS